LAYLIGHLELAMFYDYMALIDITYMPEGDMNPAGH